MILLAVVAKEYVVPVDRGGSLYYSITGKDEGISVGLYILDGLVVKEVRGWARAIPSSLGDVKRPKSQPYSPEDDPKAENKLGDRATLDLISNFNC